jgi:hypothetical protein
MTIANMELIAAIDEANRVLDYADTQLPSSGMIRFDGELYKYTIDAQGHIGIELIKPI